ncbi:MAG: chemotaxis protein CheA [Pseudomonadota bacterium]
MDPGDKFAQTYIEEATELLAELETAVLDLEDDMENPELVNRIFRAMHTIKGSGAMFDFDEIADFAHHVETFLDKIREGELTVNKKIIDLILISRDEINRMLNALNNVETDAQDRRDEIIKSFAHFADGHGSGSTEESAVSATPSDSQPQKSTEHQKVYRIRFKAGPDLFLHGINPLGLIAELSEIGELQTYFLPEYIPPLSDIDPEKCYLAWDMVLHTDVEENAVHDIFIFVLDKSEVQIVDISSAAEEGSGLQPKLGEILINRGDVSSNQVKDALSKQSRLGELLKESGAVSQEKINSALSEQNAAKKYRGVSKTTSIRVPAEKLDFLVNIVGELVTTQAQLSQAATGVMRSELLCAVEGIERLSEELRDCVLGIRMLPINTLFSKFKRMVRDLASDLGKEIDFVTEGDDTELDKTVIERINDPLVHLIRNCIDHGIETPEERIRAGKPPRGTVKLTAAHAEGEVVIHIHDDGKGLDSETIAAKAFEKGLIESTDNLSESNLFKLIFEPGFSTAKSVTDVSGRGVGMDVVKREIDSLRGAIDITSKQGKGTEIILRLPLTLAIIDGLIVSVANGQYVVPLHCVKECVELTRKDIERAHGRHMLALRDEIVPYIRLQEEFSIESNEHDIEQVVIVEAEGTRVGVVIDEIVGEKQAVIKSLGKVFHGTEGISGATIMGDGAVALILDVAQLVRTACRHKEAMYH